jgi:hypothetical protein
MPNRNSISLTFIILLLATCAFAAWPTDPAANLSIAEGGGDQVLPKLSARSGGGCYVAWMDAPTNYNVRIQRLDYAGDEMWAHNGILVSDHPQNSWLTDWDMLTDSAGNAVLVFNDIRAGGDWDIYAYKIAPDGSMLWGADGVTLSDNADFEAAPKVTETSDGEFVFVWSRSPNVGDGSIMMQRLEADGTPRLPLGGMPVAGEAGESPSFCVICPGLAGSVIVGWLRDTAVYLSDRHYRAEMFDAIGGSAWGAPVEVYNETVLPIGYEPIIQSDEAGGAVLLWHRYYGGIYNSCVQHLDAAGNELFPHNGLVVSTNAGMYHISPTLAQSGGDIYVFWDERNTSQSQWGIFGQRFAPDGTRLWGNSGRMFLPTNSLYKSFYRALPAAGGAKLFWIEEPAGYGSDQIRGFRTDSDGNFTWPGDIIDVATTPSVKGRLPVAASNTGAALIVWEDSRAGSVDVYGQMVTAEGGLGVQTGGESPALPFMLAQNHPNPFNPSTKIRFTLSSEGPTKLSVFDLEGRRVIKLLGAPRLSAGEHEVSWDGRDTSGQRLSSGIYFYTLEADGRRESRPMVLLK